jgi:small-conductance mechanosensitive channel
METQESWRQVIEGSLSRAIQALIDFLPELLGAIALIVVGWLIARALRLGSVRLARLIERLLQRMLPARARRVARPSLPPETFGSIVYWLVILFFLIAATRVLGLEPFTDWLSRVMAYLPTLLAGIVIVFAGFLFSRLGRDLVTAAAPLPGRQRSLLGVGAQSIILATAVVMGADQIGIDVTFLMILTGIAAGALLGGLALAVSLGARTYVGNLIAGHQLQQHYEVGQTIHIGDYEGTIVEIATTLVILETPQGRLTLPAKLFQEQPATRIIAHDGSDDDQ